MQALYFNQTGEAADVLALDELDKPTPPPGEVLVRILVSPINPADLFFIRGNYRFQPAFPQIAGMEGVGIVESAGSDTMLKQGTLVCFFRLRAWAEYATFAEADLITLPAGFPIEKAAQFTLNPLTAWGLLERLGLAKGEWLLLTTGNSALSRILIQLAVRRGIHVIAAVRNGKYKSVVEVLGAESIDTSQEDLETRVKALTDGNGANGVLDPIGGAAAASLVKAMALNGKLIAYGITSPDPLPLHYSSLVYKNITLSGFGIRGYWAAKSTAEKADIVQQLIAIIGKEDFKIDVAATYPYTEFKKAIAHSQESANGKILLQFGSV
jgi:NADPH:quinone reductase